MSDVICLSSDDEEEGFTFTRVSSEEEESNNVKHEAIHEVYMCDEEGEVQSPEEGEDPFSTVGEHAETEHEQPQGVVVAEMNIVRIPESSPDDLSPASQGSDELSKSHFDAEGSNNEAVDTPGNEETDTGDIGHEDANGGESSIGTCSTFKLLAEQLAEALTQSVGATQNLVEGRTSSGSCVKKANVKSNSASNLTKRRRGRPCKKANQNEETGATEAFSKNNERSFNLFENCFTRSSFSDYNTTNFPDQVDLNTLRLDTRVENPNTCNQENSQNSSCHNVDSKTTNRCKKVEPKKRAKPRRQSVKKQKTSMPSLQGEKELPGHNSKKDSNPLQMTSLAFVEEQSSLYGGQSMSEKEINQINSNLTLTPATEPVTLQGKSSKSEFCNKKAVKQSKCPKRAKIIDNSTITSKKFKNNPKEKGVPSSNSSDKNYNYIFHHENNGNVKQNVEINIGTMVNTLAEDTLKNFRDKTKEIVDNRSKKSRILNKYNSSPSRGSKPSNEQSTLKLHNQTDRKSCEKEPSIRDQYNQSPNDQEKLNKLKFTFDRSSGKEQVYVSIVSPPLVSPSTERRNPIYVEGPSSEPTQESMIGLESQLRTIPEIVLAHRVPESTAPLVSPGTERGNPISMEGLSTEPTQESMIGLECQLRTLPEIAHAEGVPESTALKTWEFDSETTDIFKHKSHFIECYKMVFDNRGDYLSNTMGKMLLDILKARIDMYKNRVNNTGNQSRNKDVEMAYVKTYDETKPKYDDLFQQLCTLIFRVPHKEQYKWLFLAWFAKVFLCINNDFEDFADKIQEIKTMAIVMVPKEFQLHQLSILQFFNAPGDEFNLNFYRVIVLMQECVGNEDQALLNNVKVEIPDNQDSTNELSSADSINDSQNYTSDVSCKAPGSNDNKLNRESELNSSTNIGNAEVSNLTKETGPASSIGDSQSNDNVLFNELNLQSKDSDNELASVLASCVEALSKTNCLQVSVIQNINTLCQSRTEEITQQPQVDQPPQNISNFDPPSSAEVRNSRCPITVKSPLAINRDHERSQNNSSLPTFSETFAQPINSDLLKLINNNVSISKTKHRTAAQYPIQDNSQTLIGGQRQTPSNTESYYQSQLSNLHRAQKNQPEIFSNIERTPSSTIQSRANTQQNQPFHQMPSNIESHYHSQVLNLQAQKYQSEIFSNVQRTPSPTIQSRSKTLQNQLSHQMPSSIESPHHSQVLNLQAQKYLTEIFSNVERTSTSTIRSGVNTQQNQPPQQLKTQPYYDANYQNSFLPNNPYRRQEIPSANQLNPLIGAPVENPTTNQSYQYDQGQNQPSVSHSQNIESRRHHFLPSTITQQNQEQYHPTGTSQTGASHAFGSSHYSSQLKISQEELTHKLLQQAMREQYLASCLQQRYHRHHNLSNTEAQPNSYVNPPDTHPTTPVAIAGTHSLNNLFKPPPPYPNARQNQQSRTNQEQARRRSQQQRNQPTNQPAPNKSVMDVPIDSVTINNFNITAYVPTRNENLYVPQNYDNLHLADRNNQFQRKPPM